MSGRQSLQLPAVGGLPSRPVHALFTNPMQKKGCKHVAQTEETKYYAAEKPKCLISHGENTHFFQPFSGLARHRMDLEAQQNIGF